MAASTLSLGGRWREENSIFTEEEKGREENFHSTSTKKGKVLSGQRKNQSSKRTPRFSSSIKKRVGQDQRWDEDHKKRISK